MKNNFELGLLSMARSGKGKFLFFFFISGLIFAVVTPDECLLTLLDISDIILLFRLRFNLF